MNIAQPHAILTVGSITYAAGAWIIQTTNDGLEWDVTAVPPADTSWNITSLGNIGDVLFAINRNSDILRSTDHGLMWEHVNKGLPPRFPNSLLNLATLGTSIFVGTGYGTIYGSKDSGRDWEHLSSALPNNIDVNALTSSRGQLFAGYGGPGMFHSYDTGADWSMCNKGLLNISTNSVVSTGDTIFIGTNAGAFRSINNGQTWQEIQKGLNSNYVHLLMSDSGNLYAGTGTQQRPLSFSTDGGSSWTTLGWMLDSELSPYGIECLARSGTTLMAGGEPRGRGNGFFISTDRGLNWAECSVNSGYTNIIPVGFLNVGATLVAATNGGPYISYDDGASWNGSYSSTPPTNALCLVGHKLFMSRFGPTSLDKGVLLASDDTGASWRPVPDTSVPVAGSIRSLASYDSTLFMGTDSSGIFLTTDYGTHWTNVSEGLTDSSILSLAIAGDELLAGTANSGVWRRRLSEMIPPSGVANTTSPPDSLAVYPDPSGDDVTISTPGLSGNVETSLISESGAVVWRKEVAADRNKVSLHLASVPNGTYVVELRSGTRNRWSKLVLVR